MTATTTAVARNDVFFSACLKLPFYLLQKKKCFVLNEIQKYFQSMHWTDRSRRPPEYSPMIPTSSLIVTFPCRKRKSNQCLLLHFLSVMVYQLLVWGKMCSFCLNHHCFKPLSQVWENAAILCATVCVKTGEIVMICIVQAFFFLLFFFFS